MGLSCVSQCTEGGNIVFKVNQLKCAVQIPWVKGKRPEFELRLTSVFVEENSNPEVTAGHHPKPCGTQEHRADSTVEKYGNVTSPSKSAVILVDVSFTNNLP